METTIVDQARATLETMAGRTADLLRALPTADVPIPGSQWTVRDAAAHLVSWSPIYSDIATGVPSPIASPAGDGAAFRDSLAVTSSRLVAGIPETDPAKLADLVVDASRRFLAATAGRPDDQLVPWHCGVPLRVADLVSLLIGEHILHGLDMAAAVGFPWPIEPGDVAVVLATYAPHFGVCVNREATKGLNIAYEVELRGLGRSVARFIDGEYHLEPADSGPVDCVISADPVTYLLVGAGRLTQWSAIALGLMSAGGERPELALSYGDLFIFP